MTTRTLCLHQLQVKNTEIYFLNTKIALEVKVELS